MTKKQSLIIGIILFVIAMFLVADIFGDFKEGAKIWHLMLEGFAASFALLGIGFLIHGGIMLKRNLEIAHSKIKDKSAEAEIWSKRAKVFLDGLAIEIKNQFSNWGLSDAEADIGFFLLKGLSLREIAQIRGTNEKTVRAQAAVIYQKSGLSGRADFAAFFLEDLLAAKIDA